LWEVKRSQGCLNRKLNYLFFYLSFKRKIETEFGKNLGFAFFYDRINAFFFFIVFYQINVFIKTKWLSLTLVSSTYNESFAIIRVRIFMTTFFIGLENLIFQSFFYLIPTFWSFEFDFFTIFSKIFQPYCKTKVDIYYRTWKLAEKLAHI